MNTEQYFLDSNILIALMDSADVHHKRAKEIFLKINQTSGQIFLSDLVINEVLSVFAKRCESRNKPGNFKILASKFQKAAQNYPILCLYALLPANYKKIISLMIKSQGHLNFHDSLIVLFLRSVTKVKLISFDQDFADLSVY